MTYQEINELTQNKYSEAIKKHKVFFAFSEKQLEEGMAENGIKSKDELISGGLGEIIPKVNLKAYMEETKRIYNWKIEEVKKLDPYKVIAYELANYECYYSGELSSVLPVLTSYGYTKDQISKVYRQELPKQDF